MNKNPKIPKEILEAYHAECEKDFKYVCSKYNVKEYGVCGIDLSKPGEIGKVASAILASGEALR
ncbi:MAG: hypothetical protein PHI84_01385 [Kiritimatiellae bacterium]|nr:hypothetical protein [Kiritimatiellia bacterium]